MFRCKQRGCNKVVRRVEDVRACAQCQRAGVRVDRDQDNTDLLTPFILGTLIGDAFHSHADVLSSEHSEESPFVGGGGDSAGGGASGSWDAPDTSPSSPSSDSGSSFDSGSSSSSE